MEQSLLICPRCGYPSSSPYLLRCPRCNTLICSLCTGSCEGCSKKRNGKAREYQREEGKFLKMLS